MPYIQIKCYPKDTETKIKIAEKINDAFLELWGCPQEAISLSFEEVAPEKWADVENNDIKPSSDKMFILSGEKKYL